MKKTLIAITCLTSIGIIPLSASEDTQEAEITGSISTSQSVYYGDVPPVVSWEITHPTPLVTPDKTLQDTIVEVRAYGVAMQYGNGSEWPVSASLYIGGNKVPLFVNLKGSQVNPNNVLHTQVVPADTSFFLEANAKGRSSRRSSTSQHVVALMDGDSAPSYAPALSQQNLVSFLTNYIDNGKITLASPNDVIYVGELYSTSTGSSWYDMQDVVIHLSFKKVPQE